jgi:hypothetical protein
MIPKHIPKVCSFNVADGIHLMLKVMYFFKRCLGIRRGCSLCNLIKRFHLNRYHIIQTRRARISSSNAYSLYRAQTPQTHPKPKL